MWATSVVEVAVALEPYAWEVNPRAANAENTILAVFMIKFLFFGFLKKRGVENIFLYPSSRVDVIHP